MQKKDFEREVAQYCLLQVNYRSVQAAVEFLEKRESPYGKFIHMFVEG